MQVVTSIILVLIPERRYIIKFAFWLVAMGFSSPIYVGMCSLVHNIKPEKCNTINQIGFDYIYNTSEKWKIWYNAKTKHFTPEQKEQFNHSLEFNRCDGFRPKFYAFFIILTSSFVICFILLFVTTINPELGEDNH